jgi:hypothetical protein
MLDKFIDELSGRGVSVLLGLLLGGLVTWLFARWRLLRLRRQVLAGDARDTVAIHLHVVQAPDGSGGKPADRPGVLRIRSLGQAELARVVPNGHLASVMSHRAFAVTAHDPLISMEGPEGSYLLETLTGFVCDRAANAGFTHDLYVMAPCCEPRELVQFQPITILLIAVSDLALFENWTTCREVQVEHGSDGARVLTLMIMAQRFKAEQTKLAQLRQQGQRTMYVETMYVLDLALDKRTAPIPIKAVPWGRFEKVLKRLNLE